MYAYACGRLQRAKPGIESFVTAFTGFLSFSEGAMNQIWVFWKTCKCSQTEQSLQPDAYFIFISLKTISCDEVYSQAFWVIFPGNISDVNNRRQEKTVA